MYFSAAKQRDGAGEQHRVIRVMQSWDDGVVDDIRLAELCRRHGAKASFNLNPGLHGASRGHGWMYGDKQVLRLARGELATAYDGFEIANHTMTHPDLTRMNERDGAVEIADARKCLQDWFGQPVEGFCFPYGRVTPATQRQIEDAGHLFARDSVERGAVPHGDAFRIVPPHCHFSAPDFWARYEGVADDGYFFFWGHSYELTSEAMWTRLAAAIERISSDRRARWVTLGEHVRSYRLREIEQ